MNAFFVFALQKYLKNIYIHLGMVKSQLSLQCYHGSGAEVGDEGPAWLVCGVATGVVAGAAVVEGGGARLQGTRLSILL